MNQLDVFVAALLGIASVMAFLFLIDYAARLLRPVSIVQRVGESGIGVIQSVYPAPTTGERPSEPARPRAAPARVVVHEGTSGVVLAVDLVGLVALARTADGMIEFVPGVGDFLAVGEPLFRLHGGAAAIDDRRLRASVALGSERTLEQDPTFALRILVDIAIKALSAAINDPTTAVMAIDQLHRLLRLVGLRALRDEELRDAEGQLRLVCLTPNWQDFVHRPARRSAIAAAAASRSSGGSARCSRTCCSRCRRIATPSCACSSSFSIAPSNATTTSRRTARWPGSAIRKGWAARSACSL